MLAVDKPAGWTSHDVVAVVRRAIGIRRVGHGGTLDPAATGVLPILVGPATRAADLLHAADKAYAARIRFGHETTTDDAEGEPTASGPIPEGAEIEAALTRFLGTIQQAPPAYAAVKVGGRRAYQLARRGEPQEIPARAVRIDRLAVASWDPPDLRLLVVCGRGTYIRALARDLGRSLGSAAHLAALRRLAVGALDAGKALGIERVREGALEVVGPALIPVDDRVLPLDEGLRSRPASEILGDWEVRG